MADGSVIIDASINTSGVEKDAQKMNTSVRSKVAKMAAEYKKQGMSMSDAMKKAWSEVEHTSKTTSERVGKNLQANIGGSADIAADKVSDMVKPVKGALGGLNSVAKNLAATIVAAFSVRAVAAFAKECIDLGSDLAEVQNVVDVTFGDLNKQVNQFAKNAITQFGLSELAAKQYTSTMGAMLKSMGFTTDAAADMGMKMAGLAGDIASFYNLEADDAFAKIRAGISGETEPLKQLGINLSVANLEQYALTQGITESYEAMTEQEKVMLRYNYLLSATADAQGDFARTSDGWANQTRVLTEQFNSLKATLGQAFINALTPVLELINEVIGKIQGFADYLLAFTESVFGDAGTSQAASSAEALAEGYDAATESVEELKKSQKELAGFDEITRIGNKDESGAADAQLPAVVAKSQDDVKKEAKAMADAVADTFAKFIGKVKKLGKRLVKAYSPSIEAWSKALEEIAPAVEEATGKITSGFTKHFKEDIAPLADYIVFEWGPAIANSFNEMAAPIFADLVPAQVDSAVESVEFFCEASSEAIDGLEATLRGLEIAWGDVCDGISKSWGEHGDDIVEGSRKTNKSLGELLGSLYTKIIKPIITNIGDEAGDLWSKHLAPLWNKICDALGTVGTAIMNLWNNFLSPVLDFIVTVFAPIITQITNYIVDLLGNGVGFIADLVGGLIDIFSGLISFICNIFAGKWGAAWDGIVTAFKGVLNVILALVAGLLNAIIAGINFFLTLIFSVLEAIVDAIGWIAEKIGGLFGKDWGWNVDFSNIRIPYWDPPQLAQGAVLPANKPFLAMVGDQKHGTNIEAPLSTIQEAVAIVMEDVIASNIAGQEAIIVILKDILEAVLGIEIGDEVIGQAVSRYNRKMAAIRGGVS